MDVNEKIDPSTLYFENPWIWYGHYPCASTNYGKSYIEMGRFQTIAEFWQMYHHFPSIDAVHDGMVSINGYHIIAYSLFREGIKPEWEDPVNIIGSEWGCRENLDKARFNELWFSYILGAIGENITNCVGVRAINKSNRTRCLHKIEVWMNKSDTPSVQKCRRSLTALVPSSPRFVHMPHQEKQHQAIEYQKQRRRQRESHSARATSDCGDE